jgi:hypothetical protein
MDFSDYQHKGIILKQNIEQLIQHITADIHSLAIRAQFPDGGSFFLHPVST